MQSIQRCVITLIVVAAFLGPTGMLLYTVAAKEAPATTTEWLRAEAGADWTAITTDPFVEELAAGTLDNATLTRYLVQDHKFVDGFMARGRVDGSRRRRGADCPKGSRDADRPRTGRGGSAGRDADRLRTGRGGSAGRDADRPTT